MLYQNKSEAEATAAALTAGDDDGWTYAVVARFGGWAIVVRDETGALMGAL